MIPISIMAIIVAELVVVLSAAIAGGPDAATAAGYLFAIMNIVAGLPIAHWKAMHD